MLKSAIIIQARMNSSSLLGKVLKEVCGKPVLVHVLERLSLSDKVNDIVHPNLMEKNVNYLSDGE